MIDAFELALDIIWKFKPEEWFVILLAIAVGLAIIL